MATTAAAATSDVFILLRDYTYVDDLERKVTHPPGTLLVMVSSEVSVENPPQGTLILAMLSTELQVPLAVLPVAVSDVPGEFVAILRAVPLRHRLQLFMNRLRMEEVALLRPGDHVRVVNKADLPENAAGILRYRGELGEKQGEWFGVELAPAHHGMGTTDGTWRRDLCFSCKQDCGLFLNGTQIRAKNSAFDVSLDIGDRVLWPSDKLGQQWGTVQWMGFLSHWARSVEDIMVGVEFDHPIGGTRGKVKGKQLFLTKKGHAAVLSIRGLIADRDAVPMATSPATGAGHGSSSHVPSTVLTGRGVGEAQAGGKNDSEEVFALVGGRFGPSRIPEERDHKLAHSSGSTFPEQQQTGPSTPGTDAARTAVLVTSLASPVGPEMQTPLPVPPPGKQLNTSTTTTSSGFSPRSSAELHSQRKANFPPTPITGDNSADIREREMMSGSDKSKQNGAAPPQTALVSIETPTQSVAPELTIGSRVQIFSDPTEKGTIVWIGRLQGSPKTVAGVKMDKANPRCYTQGSYAGMHLFSCDGEYRAYFCRLSMLTDCLDGSSTDGFEHPTGEK